MIQARDLRLEEKPKVKRHKQKVLQLRGLSKEDTWEYLKRMGFIDSNKLYDNFYKNIEGCWQDEPCYIFGAGPPLKGVLDSVGWNFFDDKHTIGINHVIEDYDRFEWFFFLDKRFLDRTTYNMDDYQGHIFAQSTTGLKPSENTTIFTCNTMTVGTQLEHGLYSPNFSGLSALNLALLTGANPIYLIGYGNGKEATNQNYHYKSGYTGEVRQEKIFEKYKRVYKQFKPFKAYNSRVYHVTDGEDIPTFRRKMKIDDFKRHADKCRQLEITQAPKVVHFSFSDDINRHADITRNIINECYGNHVLLSQNEKIPQADLYILEHFQSTNKFVKRFPYPKKAINIVHTVGCIPNNQFKVNIALTDAWIRYLKGHFINNVERMYIGIDLEPYKDIYPQFESKNFGRITRWSPSKIHPKWNDITIDILNETPGARSTIFTQLDHTGGRQPLKHNMVKYDDGCSIEMFKGDFLKQLSVYCHVNGSFIDTFSHGVLEGMASGLPVVILQDKVGAVAEVAGKAGIVCKTIQQVKQKIQILLTDKDIWKEYSKLSKERASFFAKEKMIRQMNGVIRRCLKR